MSRLQNNIPAGLVGESSNKSINLSAMRFARQVHKMPELMEIWSRSVFSGSSTFNHILHVNSSYISQLKPSVNNIITPGGFAFQVFNAAVGKDNFIFELPSLNIYTRVRPGEISVSFNAVLCFFSPLRKENNIFDITGICYEIPDFNFCKSYKSSVKLNRADMLIKSRYADCIFYLALVTKDAKGNIVNYSRTYSEEFRTVRRVLN